MELAPSTPCIDPVLQYFRERCHRLCCSMSKSVTHELILPNILANPLRPFSSQRICSFDQILDSKVVGKGSAHWALPLSTASALRGAPSATGKQVKLIWQGDTMSSK